MANYYSWTDDPIVANVHPVRAAYYSELTSNMNKVRGYVADFTNAYTNPTVGSVYFGQTAYSYSVSPTAALNGEIVASTTNDLRDALDDVNSAWASFHGSWSWCGQYSNNETP